ncbi:hypothetical protein Mgra_00007907 [Meloidogyne graminicola]|uniref:Uncharacterized protein n=1 Tax=Meloidogyne graminicola TaxID=189291 RepID=A0A8S9ZH86_9BILA|nr:hypothetical protein Mgra_00007907 [Meloidogyne graminicola]
MIKDMHKRITERIVILMVILMVVLMVQLTHLELMDNAIIYLEKSSIFKG